MKGWNSTCFGGCWRGTCGKPYQMVDELPKLVNSSHLGEAPRWRPSEPVIFRQHTFWKSVDPQKNSPNLPMVFHLKIHQPQWRPPPQRNPMADSWSPKKKDNSHLHRLCPFLAAWNCLLGQRGRKIPYHYNAFLHGIYHGKKMDDGL